MENPTKPSVTSRFSLIASSAAIVSNAIAFLALLSLHMLSPEFDPSWRMVSEYANGRFSLVLSLMFAAWGIGSVSLALAFWTQAKSRSLRIGLGLLLLSGVGELMASIFDITHPLHDIAGYLGIISLPIAAFLVGGYIRKQQPTTRARSQVFWTTVLPLASLIAFVGTFVLLMASYSSSGGTIDPTVQDLQLPAGVIALVGWTNRLLIITYLYWVSFAAWKSKTIRITELSSL